LKAEIERIISLRFQWKSIERSIEEIELIILQEKKGQDEECENRQKLKKKTKREKMVGWKNVCWLQRWW